MANLQVKSFDDRLYEALARRAALDNRSISQEVVAIIKEYFSKPNNSNKTATDSFLELAGTWNDDRNADEIILDIRKNRKSDRRFKEVRMGYQIVTNNIRHFKKIPGVSSVNWSKP